MRHPYIHCGKVESGIEAIAPSIPKALISVLNVGRLEPDSDDMMNRLPNGWKIP